MSVLVSLANTGYRPPTRVLVMVQPLQPVVQLVVVAVFWARQ